ANGSRRITSRATSSPRAPAGTSRTVSVANRMSGRGKAVRRVMSGPFGRVVQGRRQVFQGRGRLGCKSVAIVCRQGIFCLQPGSEIVQLWECYVSTIYVIWGGQN